MMGKTIFLVMLSSVPAIALGIISAKTSRNKANVFYFSTTFLNVWASVVFSMGVAFLLKNIDIYNGPRPFEKGAVGMMVFLWFVWGIPFFALISGISKKFEVKGHILLKKDLFSTEYIDISKITYIEEVSSSDSSHFSFNMSDGTSFMFDEGIAETDRLFYRIGQINDQIHFSFPVHYTGEGSFFDRIFNIGTAMSVIIYMYGFYVILVRIL